MDLKSLVQYMATVACQTLKRARLVSIADDDNTMPANLFVCVEGAPASGKSMLAKALLGPVEKRQRSDFASYLQEWEEYQQKKREFEKSKDPDFPRPIPPVLKCSITHDATMEAVIDRAKTNPEGIFLYADEGAGLATFGASRYNKGSEPSTLAKFIRGFESGFVMTDRKNHEGEQQVAQGAELTLAYTMNVQEHLVPLTFNDQHDQQGYLQRFLHIHVPPSPAGEEGSIFRLDAEECQPRVDFYSEVVNKILNLQIVPRMNALKFSKEAWELHDAWCRAITKRCKYGDLIPYVKRFCQIIIPRIALGLHFLHVAVKCVEQDMEIAAYENDNPQRIEKEDLERAVRRIWNGPWCCPIFS